VQEFPDSDWATEAERAQLEAIWQKSTLLNSLALPVADLLRWNHFTSVNVP
jgi:hypothetical protein